MSNGIYCRIYVGSMTVEIHKLFVMSFCAFSLLLVVPRLFSYADPLRSLGGVTQNWVTGAKFRVLGNVGGHFVLHFLSGKECQRRVHFLTFG